MKKAEDGSLKVRFGKNGKVMFREITMNTPYLKGEKLYRAVIDPYTREESKSRTLSPKLRMSAAELSDSKPAASSNHLTMSEAKFQSQVKLPKLLNSGQRPFIVSQSVSGKTNLSPYGQAPLIPKKKPAPEYTAPKPKLDRPHQMPIFKPAPVQQGSTRTHYVVAAHYLV